MSYHSYDFENYRVPEELRGELIKKLSKCNVYEGCVSYFWQGFIDSIHRKKIKLVDVKLHSLFFDDFDFNKYLNLMLLKRDAFEHEHETRIMIVPNNRSKKKSINGTGTFMDVKINWGRVIKEVRYDASITKSQKKELMDILKKLNNGIIVKPYYVNGRKSHITIGV